MSLASASSQRQLRRRAFCRAFTLVELLVVIGVIAVLAAFFLPVLSAAREQGYRAVCLSNERQLTSAWIAYTAEHDQLISSQTSVPTDWVTAGNADVNMVAGTLYPYVKSVGVYRCPSDSNLTNDRSYSINGVLNGETGWTPRILTQLRQVTRPAQTFVFIEEFDYRGFNGGSFACYASGDTWVDRPAHLHRDGCTISFADGHATYWHFADLRTLTIDFFTTTPNNPDLTYLKSSLGI